jgi:hypothetical protein
MITPSTLSILKSHCNSQYQILSVYLGFEGSKAIGSKELLTQLDSLVHEKLSKTERVFFGKDITNIKNYLKNYTPTAKSLIFFSAGDNLWQVVHLEFYLEQSIIIGNSPYLLPIVEALDKHSMYLVMLVDREKVRMFTVEQGEMVDHSDYKTGHIPQVAKSTGRDYGLGRSDINHRHNEVTLRRHIKLTAEKVASFTKNQNIRFVILGGHSEIFKKVSSSLPTNLRNKILDRFVTEINIPLNELMLESKQIAARLSVST